MNLKLRRGATAGAVLCLTTVSPAALIGVEPGFPLMSYDNSGVLTYVAVTGELSIDATPLSIRFAAGEPPRLVMRTGSPASKSVSIAVRLDGSGNLIGGVDGDDLTVIGEVDSDGDGDVDFAGVLLTGEALQFGYLNTPIVAAGPALSGGAGVIVTGDGMTDRYDFRFRATGGSMQSFYEEFDIGVTVTSEMSTFDGSFIVDFGGEAKGAIGPVEPIGACCLDKARCKEMTAGECAAAGGAYQGDMTSCATVTCAPTGACCLPDGSCAQLAGSDCGAAGGSFQGSGVGCTPVALGDAGTYRLRNHPEGAQTRPFYGLRLDELFDVTPGNDIFTFDFEAPGAAMEMDHDGGSTIRIHGTAFGGRDIGGAYDPAWSSLVEIDFTYGNVEDVPGDDDQWVLEGLSNAGTLTWLATGEVFILKEKADATGVTFRAGDEDDDLGHRGVPGISGWGWLMGDGAFADWLFLADNVCAPPPVGACCLEDGTCVEATPAACAAQGGIHQGDLTQCADIECPQPKGACCLADGSCTFVTEEVCASLSGAYQGDFVVCAAVDCPQPPGACCMEDGSCVEVTEEVCASLGGAYQGDFVVCATVDCPQPPGACCLIDGSCVEVTEGACQGLGGVFQGDLTLCRHVPCPQPAGACCLEDGTCVEVTEVQCGEMAGEYQGDFTFCADVTCPQPDGACCLADRECDDDGDSDSESDDDGDSDSSDDGGSDDVDCDSDSDSDDDGDSDSSDAEGSDLAADGADDDSSGDVDDQGPTCEVLSRSACEAQGGAYQGDGTTCEEAACIGPVGACCLPAGACDGDGDSDSDSEDDGDSDSSEDDDGGSEEDCDSDSDSEDDGDSDSSDERGGDDDDDSSGDDDGGATCEVTTQSACDSLGGVYQGDGTTCDAVDCSVGGGGDDAQWGRPEIDPSEGDSGRAVDLIDVLRNWGAVGRRPEDVDGDGVVGPNDLVVLLTRGGAPP